MFTSSKQQTWSASLPQNSRADGQETITDSLRAVPTRLQVTVWIVLIALTLAISLYNYQSVQIGLYNDDANYILLARSLAQGGDYGLINTPEQPATSRFPFGYPLVLAPIVALAPHNLEILRLPSLLATLANGALLFWGWRWFSRSTSYWMGLAATGLYLLAPLTIIHTRMVMSEAVFTTFCLIALIATEKIARAERWSSWWVVLLAGSLAMVVATRTVGVIVIGSVFLYLLLLKRIQALSLLSVVSALLIATLAFILMITPIGLDSLIPVQYFQGSNASFLAALNLSVSNEAPEDVLAPRYVAPVSSDDANSRLKLKTLLYDFGVEGVRQHLGRDVRLTVLHIGGGEREDMLAQRVGLPWLPLVLGFALSGIVAVGFFRWFHDGLIAAAFFAVIYFFALFIWVWEGARLLYPIQPQLFLGFLLGIEALLLGIRRILPDRLPAGTYTLAFGGAVVMLFLFSLYKDATIRDTRFYTGDIRTRSTWLRENTQTTDIVMTEAPAIDYFYSDRKTVSFPEECATAGSLAKYISAQDADYILVAPAVKWHDNGYIPEYSDTMSCFLSQLVQLANSGEVRQAYAAPTERIRVYAVEH